MLYIQICLLISGITFIQALNIVYLENCTYSVDLYKEYLNLLWVSNDSRTLHIQAVYSLSSNKSLIPGHIYSYLSRSVAVIPFFVQCQSLKTISSQSYLPFTRCSSTKTNFLLKKNYESARTNLNLNTILTMKNVPLIYIGEYYLILSNCSFQLNSTMYKLKSNEIFSFRIEYESSILTNCYSCNRRTSICYEKICQCRIGTMPIKLRQDKRFCIDVTQDCALDSQRCLYSESLRKNPTNEFIFILLVLISCVFILFLSLLWFLYRYINQSKQKGSSSQSLFVIDKQERTSSTLSTSDSMTLNIENQYPKIIGERNNGEILFILA